MSEIKMEKVSGFDIHTQRKETQAFVSPATKYNSRRQTRRASELIGNPEQCYLEAKELVESCHRGNTAVDL